MPPAWIVPAFDELEDGLSCLGWISEALPVDQLTFQGGEEALAHGVVISVAGRPHGGTHAHRLASLAEGDGGVVRPLVGMVDDTLGAPLRQSHVQGLQDQLCPQMCRHRPADDAPAEGIEYDREVEEAGPARHLGDVGDPQPVRRLDREVVLDQVRRRTRTVIADRGSDRFTPADTAQAGPAHQAGNTLAPDMNAQIAQLGMNTRRPVGAVRGGVDAGDPPRQGRIVLFPPARLMAAPRVIAAGGDAQQPTHRGDRIHGPVRPHEREDPSGIASVSRANQAAAFARISRS